MSIPLYVPTRDEADHKFPVDPNSGKRYCEGCRGCGVWHCAYPEECGFAAAFEGQTKP